MMPSFRFFFASVSIAVVAYFVFRPLPACYDGKPMETRAKIRIVSTLWSFISVFEKYGVRTLPFLRMLVLSKLPDTELLQTIDTNFDSVRVRVYLPTKRVANGPAILYTHGGGWVLGDLEYADKTAHQLATELNVVLVSVDYRLAPESPYPAAIDDTEIAYRYLVKHAEEYQIDPSRIAVTGDSAGGNLAASLSVRLRDSKLRDVGRQSEVLPLPKLQILFYPLMQGVNFSSVSMLVHRDDLLQSRSRMMDFVLQYSLGMDFYNQSLRDEARRYLQGGCFRLIRPDLDAIFTNEGQDIRERILTVSDRAYIESLRRDAETRGLVDAECTIADGVMLQELHRRLERVLAPDFSPLYVADVAGLPPAYVLTCGVDILLDGDLLFIERLRDAGLLIEHNHKPRDCHGFISFDPEEVVADVRKFLSRNSPL